MNTTNIICNSYFEYSSGILNIILIIVTIIEITLGYSTCCKSNTVVQLPAEIFKNLSENNICNSDTENIV